MCIVCVLTWSLRMRSPPPPPNPGSFYDAVHARSYTVSLWILMTCLSFHFCPVCIRHQAGVFIFSISFTSTVSGMIVLFHNIGLSVWLESHFLINRNYSGKSVILFILMVLYKGIFVTYAIGIWVMIFTFLLTCSTEQPQVSSHKSSSSHLATAIIDHYRKYHNIP